MSAAVPDFTLFALLNKTNDCVDSFCLIAREAFSLDALTIREEDWSELNAYRYKNLESIFGKEPQSSSR